MKIITTDFNNVDAKGRLFGLTDGAGFHPGERVTVFDPEGLSVIGYVDGTKVGHGGNELVYVRPLWNTLEILS